MGIHGEAFACEASGERCNLAECHGAVLLERGDPGVQCGRHDAARNAVGNGAAEVALKVFARRGLGPGAKPADGDDFFRIRQVDDDRGDPGETSVDRLQHVGGEARRNPGVDGVAASLEDL